MHTLLNYSKEIPYAVEIVTEEFVETIRGELDAL